MSARRLILVRTQRCPEPRPALTHLQAQYLEVIGTLQILNPVRPSIAEVKRLTDKASSTYANLECLRRKGLVYWAYGKRRSLCLTAEGWRMRAIRRERGVA